MELSSILMQTMLLFVQTSLIISTTKEMVSKWNMRRDCYAMGEKTKGWKCIPTFCFFMKGRL